MFAAGGGGGDERESRLGTAMFTFSFCFPTSPSPITLRFPETPAPRRGPGWKTLLFGAVKHVFRGLSTLTCLLAYQTQADISVKRAPFFQTRFTRPSAFCLGEVDEQRAAAGAGAFEAGAVTSC